MKLIALKDAYKAEALEKGLIEVKTFRFDDMSDINEPSLTARILLFKPPNSIRLKAPDQDYKVYKVSYFLFDLVGDSVGEAEADLWESIEDDIVAINKGIVDNNTDVIEIQSDISFENNHHTHGNADYIGIWAQYDLRVFDCINP